MSLNRLYNEAGLSWLGMPGSFAELNSSIAHGYTGCLRIHSRPMLVERRNAELRRAKTGNDFIVFIRVRTMLASLLDYYKSLPLTEEALRFQLEKWLSMQRSWCCDMSFATQFPWKETGLPAHYFLQRQVDVDGGHYLTGPRYMAGDLARPFVDIVAFDAPITSHVITKICREWSEIKPQRVRILVPGDIPVCGETDQLIYASALTSKGNEAEEHHLTLIRADARSLSWCMQGLTDAYQRAWEAMPALKESLLPTNERTLMEKISDGSVFILYEEAQRVGFIVCEEGTVGFLQAFQITEEVILPEYQGRSLASLAQQVLRKQLCLSGKRNSLLAGTIVPGNRPSIRVAEKAGRRCVFRYEFLPAGQP
ncbi:GNAT family N-acetyltransferase [Pantoea stewartii]|uniref:GNAT family N-acetyltransferase n=1 Tax=Pantoea stewartii TaxID=66269 RepID=UPI00156255EC|nr:GNAT family N-acetyltransferase [Pantoea stewartii]